MEFTTLLMCISHRCEAVGAGVQELKLQVFAEKNLLHNKQRLESYFWRHFEDVSDIVQRAFQKK